MKVTDLMVQCLENEGVEYIFGIMGSETVDLIDSLSKSQNIQYITVRHEQSAAFMADVYGRLSNKVGVCLATLGPGAINLLTGIASANLDYSPVVAITGQAGFERQHKESHQYLDLVKIFEPSTKWSVQIKNSETTAEIIRKAFRLAKMEKPGAVLIELPENLAAQMISTIPLPVIPIPSTSPVEQSIKDAYSLIQQSKKPLIIIGNGVIRQNAIGEVQAFIEKLQSPAIHSFTAKGILSKNHPLNYFTFGFKEKDEATRVIDESDLLIVIGFDLVERLPKDWNKKKLPILHIDALPAEMDEYYPVQLELVGEVKQFLHKLEPSPKPWVPSGNLKEQIKQSYQIDTNEVNPLLSIENVISVIEKLSSDKSIVISDVGAHKVSIARTYQPKKANGLIISNGLASMGIAIPGAIGAKLACPDEHVICITGDGGALMNFAEIETAKRLGTSLIIIILNDGKLKLEEQMMLKKFNSTFGTPFGNPDYVQLAKSFGIKGVRPKDLADFEQMLTTALSNPSELTLIDVLVN
ncbi:acetolactate synthase large subunit [Bacillus sp. CGMCC 1.16607]|uniref:acetolactate synthase large subunit n=1 Tax=Bacillus sp. CGMCC 1.16607 TaxID=3351842 RepID=UPI00362C0A35